MKRSRRFRSSPRSPLSPRSWSLAPLLMVAGLGACASEPPPTDPALARLDHVRAAEGARLVDELLRDGEVDRAVTVADTLVRRDGTAAESHRAVARAHAAKAVIELDPAAYADAIREATLACEAAPDDAEAWYVRGKLQFDRRRYSQALDDFAHALELDPRHRDALRMTAWAERALGRPMGERQAWTALVETYPDDARGHVRLGQILIVSEVEGEPALGLEHLDRAVTLDPNDDLALHELARARAAEGDHAEAERLLRRAVAASAGRPVREADALYNLGAAVLAQGRRDEARVLFERCLALNPDEHRALGNLGYLLLEAGDTAEGRRRLRQAADREENRDVRRRIEALLEESRSSEAGTTEGGA